MGLSIKTKIILLTLVLVLFSSIVVGVFIDKFATVKSDGDVSSIEEYRKQTLALIGAAMLITVLVTIGFSYKLLSPVDDLIIGTQIVAQGRLDHKIKNKSSDELGRLIDSFNHMITKLKVSYERSSEFSNMASVEKQKAELIIDSMADSVIVTDHEHRVVLFNPAAVRLFDIDEKKVVAKHIMHLLKRYKLEKLFEDFPEIREKILPERNLDIKVREFRVEKLTQKVLKATTAPLKSESNMIIGTVVVFEDITKAKELDEMKTDFVSTVSHELRTPLTSIKGYAALLDDGRLGDLNDTQQKAASTINTESDRLTDLINDILNLSKLEAKQAKAVFTLTDLNECIDASPLLNVAKGKGIQVRKIIPKDLEKIMLDKAKIIQVFNNILSNAIKFTKPKGKIQIKVSDQKDFIRVDIKDSGIGIPKKDIPNLFNKFYQVESHLTRNQGGTGLGLPIVKEIIGLHQGLISVKSKIHKGTTVSFALPMSGISEAELVKCWEERGCKKIKCPAYQNNDKRCWLYIGTQCKKSTNEPCFDKIEICKYCDIYKRGLETEENTDSR